MVLIIKHWITNYSRISAGCVDCWVDGNERLVVTNASRESHAFDGLHFPHSPFSNYFPSKNHVTELNEFPTLCSIFSFTARPTDRANWALPGLSPLNAHPFHVDTVCQSGTSSFTSLHTSWYSVPLPNQSIYLKMTTTHPLTFITFFWWLGLVAVNTLICGCYCGGAATRFPKSIIKAARHGFCHSLSW